jgi:hypothetical protein
VTTATYAIRRNQNLARQRTNIKLGPISATFVIIVAISVLALLYLNQITKTNVFGYKVTELQKQANDLAASKQDLEVQAARLQSIREIQKSPAVAQMVPESQVSYAR